MKLTKQRCRNRRGNDMLKRKRMLLIIFFMSAAAGVVLGVLLSGKTGSAAHMNGFSWAAAVFAVAALGAQIVSFLSIKKDQKQFGTSRFTVNIRRLKLLKLIFFLFLVLTAAVGAIAVASSDPALLPIFLLSAAIALMYGVRNNLDNGINENGVFYWGVFYAWDKAMRYKIEEMHHKTVLILEIKIWSRGLDFDFDLNLILNPREKDEIERFVKEKVKVVRNLS